MKTETLEKIKKIEFYTKIFLILGFAMYLGYNVGRLFALIFYFVAKENWEN